jgi:hypothetical protein
MPQPTNTHTGTPQPQHSAAASPSTGKQLATDEKEMQLAGPAMITSAEVRPDFTNPKSTELGIPAKEPRQLWTDVITGNRNPSNGLQLKFVAPQIVNGSIEVEIDEEDILSELLYWKSALIMYVIGGDLSMNAVKGFMTTQWNFVKLPDMLYNEEGYFILRFHSIQEKEEVLMKGPYTIHKMPMLLRDWKPDFSLKKDMLRTIPIWVKLPQLPLYLWGQKSLEKIGSALGNPVVSDECTAQKLRASYARILVEMDVTKPMATEIIIKDKEGQKMTQPVEYEWRPKFCQRCQKVGHSCDDNPVKKPVKQWQPKAASQDKAITAVASKQEDKKEDAETTWTTVERQKKGKGVVIDVQPSAVKCDNIFDSLKALQEPLGDKDGT